MKNEEFKNLSYNYNYNPGTYQYVLKEPLSSLFWLM